MSTPDLSTPSLRIGIDIGGTFTDFVAVDDRSGRIFTEKVLTTPHDPAEAVLRGLDLMFAAHGFEASTIAAVIHGTTLVANALIERKGAVTALVTTAGFRDALEIRREWRYDAYDLFFTLPAPLVPRRLRFEVPERLGADGSLVVPFDTTAAERVAEQLRAAGIEAVAVCFLHAYRDGAHEARMREVLGRIAPGLPVSLSHEVAPERGEFERASTTAANAYVQPLFRRYLGRLDESLGARGIGREMLMMLSDGGVIGARAAAGQPVRLVQSGPAGGAQATALIGRLAGAELVFGFDMGGTTAKSCLIEHGQPMRTTDFEVARQHRFKRGSGLPLKVPVVDMIEIGAGGGSIARLSGTGLIEVGPASAGADPGPACYSRGGSEPTVTDCDLVLGLIDAGRFLGGDMALDIAAARAAIETRLARPLGLSVEAAAVGVFETVTENMAQSAAIHAIERGRRIADAVMVPIGGAGPVHAAAIARRLGVRRVVCPLGAGVASALGFLAAPVSFAVVRDDLAPLSGSERPRWNRLVAAMQAEAMAPLAQSGIAAADAGTRIEAHLRYRGQGHEIAVEVPGAWLAGDGEMAAASLGCAFADTYRALYGRVETVPVEITSWRVVVSGPLPRVVPQLPAGHARGDGALRGRRPVWFAEARGFVDTPVFDRYALGPGWQAEGPAVVEERESTAIAPPGARLAVDSALNLVIELAS
ncbi:MAG: hydantoinase/oxoprolinase family protein [Alphaproteobacteria bacterium]|nr:hydantoinase/oxoprolinase family protein [Alphaproteobacteria bacterium]